MPKKSKLVDMVTAIINQSKEKQQLDKQNTEETNTQEENRQRQAAHNDLRRIFETSWKPQITTAAQNLEKELTIKLGVIHGPRVPRSAYFEELRTIGVEFLKSEGLDATPYYKSWCPAESISAEDDIETYGITIRLQ